MVTMTSPPRLEEAGLERGRLPEVPAEADDDDVRRARRGAAEQDRELPSVEPSSTKTTSNGSSLGSSAAAISL